MTPWKYFKWEYRFSRYNHGPVVSFFKALVRALTPVPFSESLLRNANKPRKRAF